MMAEIIVSVSQLLAPSSEAEIVHSVLTYSQPQANAVKEILAERDYQDEIWGPAFDRSMTDGQWLDIIRDYAYGHGRATGYDFRKRMLKVAATALAAVESIDGKASRA